jgi:hypothetical protein
MNNHYDITKWAENATKNFFVWQFFLADNVIPGWKITEKNGAHKIDNGVLIEYYLINGSAKDEAIKIDVYEFSSWNEAAQNLLKILQDHHMAEKLPETNTERNDLGDVAYKGFGQTDQHILFIRANMLIILNSIGSRDISVRSVTPILDAHLFKRQHSSEKKLAPEILKFSINDKKSLIIEKRQVGIDVAAADPLQRPVWYKFFADNGEFFRNEGEIFFLPEQEKNHLTVFAINENDQSSEKTIDF